MGTPIPGEKAAPANLDLARVGLHDSPKAPLLLGAGPSEHASPSDGGLFRLAFAFSFELAVA